MFLDAPPDAAGDSAALPPGAADWEVRDLLVALAIIVGAFALLIAVLVLVDAAGLVDTTARDEPGIVATIVFEVAFALGVLALARRRGLGLRELGFVRPRRWGPVVTAFVGAYMVVIGYGAVIALLEALGLSVGLLEADNIIPGGDERGPVLLLLLGFAVLLTAPLAEELYFRGLWYPGLRGLWGVAPALALSGLLFGAFHLNLGVLVPFTLVGVVFAWANEESGSLWTSIVAHAGFNGVSFVLTVAGVEA